MPEEAKGTSKAAAEAFVKYYFELIDYAQSTGDTSPLDGYAHRLCEGCRSGSRRVRQIYAAEGRIAGGEHQITRARAFQLTQAPTFDMHVKVTFTTTPQEVSAEGARFDSSSSGGESRMNIRLIRELEEWKTLDLWEAK